MNERPAPSVVVELPLEGEPRVHVVAETFEDEQRLRNWLRRLRTLDELPRAVARALDDEVHAR